MSFGNERESINFLQVKERKFVCPHLHTTIIDDKRYCVDCGEEVIREDD